MARRGGIDRLTRGPRIGQQERSVHGQPLGRCDGERIAVIETDIAVPVADLIVTEADLSSVLCMAGNQDARLRTGLTFVNCEVVHRDHGAVEQLLLPVGGADTQPVAACDLERRSRPFVFRTPAYDHRHPFRIGPFSIRQRGEPAFPHQMRKSPHLGPCARQHHAGLVGVRPLVAIPVINQTGQRLFFIISDMEPASCVMSRDGRYRIAIAQGLRRGNLPRRELGLLSHGLVVAKNFGAFLLSHQFRAEPRCLRRLAMDMNQDILRVRFLAPYAVHPHAANGVADQPQPRSRFHRLLLLCVAREDDLRSMAFGELENVMRLAGRQHPRFVDDNGGVSIDLDPTPRGKAQQLVDTERSRIDIVAKRHRRAPGHGRGDNALSVFAVEIGNGPSVVVLPEPAAPSMMATRPPDDVTFPDRYDLFLAQRITRLQQPRHLCPDSLGGQGMARIGGHAFRHIPDFLLHLQVVTGRIQPRVRHIGPALGRTRRAGQAHHLGA